MKRAQRHKSYDFRNPTYMRGMLTGSLIVGGTFLCYEYARLKEEQKIAEDTEKQAKLQKIRDEKLKVKTARGMEILRYGEPQAGRKILYYANHAVLYDQQKKIPIWVAEQISGDRLKGEASRRSVEFQPDPGIDPMFSAQNSDYRRSGWSRGHMSPAGNNKLSQEAMAESFLLTNILPQNFENNGGFWNRLEMYCRELAKNHASVNIISGPVFKPEVGEDGKKIMKYPVIGENNVSVPTHLFKIITLEDHKQRPRALGAFIVPNEPIGYSHQLWEYQVKLEEVEKLTGVKFMPKVKREGLKDLCRLDGCKLMGRTEFELYFIGRKLESANTMNRLEKVWGELEGKQLKPDKFLTNLYDRKKKELSQRDSGTATGVS